MMDFVRAIIESDKLAGILNIPEKLRHSPVEVIILPASNPEIITTETGSPKKEKYRQLYENPIKVRKIHIFSRDELHER